MAYGMSVALFFFGGRFWFSSVLKARLLFNIRTSVFDSNAGVGHPHPAAQQPDRSLADQVPGGMGSQVHRAVHHRQHAEVPTRGKSVFTNMNA